MHFKFVVMFLVCHCLDQSLGSLDVPDYIYKKIAKHQLNTACWGERNVLQFYKTVKSAQEKCLKLTPTFDIDIGVGDQHMIGNEASFFDAPTNPFTRFDKDPTGFSSAVNNPYDAWMAFLAFQQFQQQRRHPGMRKYNSLRYKRGAQSASEVAEFQRLTMDFNLEMKQNLGNLTCVLADMGALDANLNINLRYFTHDGWNEMKDPVDPEFRARLTEAYQDCFEVSNSIPQSVLDKHPMAGKFGRHLFFFKCTQKAERAQCAKQELVKWMEDLHEEPVTTQLLQQLGLPQDKFEASLVAVKAMHKQHDGARKFVAEFMWGENDD